MKNSQNPILFIIPGACSFGSMVTLELLGIPYQVCITDEKIRASAEFRLVNPSGKVAALKDSQVCVGENLAIILYLLDAYGTDQHDDDGIGSSSFYPAQSDWQYRAKMYQWLSYCSSTLHPAFSQVNYAHKYTTQHTEEFKAEAYQRLLLILDYVDHALQEGYLLFSDRFTVVDAQAYGILRWISYVPDSEQVLAKRPYIAQFFSRVKEINAVQNAIAIEHKHAEQITNSKFTGYFTINV